MPRAPWWPPTRASSSRTTGHGSSSAAGVGVGHPPSRSVCPCSRGVSLGALSAWQPLSLWAAPQPPLGARSGPRRLALPGRVSGCISGAARLRARLRVRLRRALSLGRPRCGFSMRPVSHVACGPDSSRCWGCGLHPLDQGRVGQRGAGGSPLRSHSVPPRVWITTVLQKTL